MGAAFSNKFRKTDRVAVCFFGDGASNEGSFHEAANMAALYKLPCVFVCENNGYGEYTPQANHQAIVDVADRAPGYGMPGVVVDGMDALAVYEAAGEAIDRARRGEGPTLLECKTYRFYDHVGRRGMGMNYRTDEEVERWMQRDPINLLEALLAEQNVCRQRMPKRCARTSRKRSPGSGGVCRCQPVAGPVGRPRRRLRLTIGDPQKRPNPWLKHKLNRASYLTLRPLPKACVKS